MTNPTTPFSWQMPQATDLVTDLPADFETFGQAVATSMADLLGGTTGQVLSKTSNTDMDFTWVTSDDANAIQNAIVDAKGDLIAASAADTPARLAVGSNGSTLVADSAQTTGLGWSATPSASNPVLNSAFQIWSRGTSGTANSFAAGAGYNADRWQNYSGNALTVSRQLTGDSTNLPNIKYCQRVQRNAGQTSTSVIYNSQTFESYNSAMFAGKTVTVSFYARKGANYSTASSVLSLELATGTGDDQNVLGGFTGRATPINLAATLTTTWQRFTATAALSSTTNQLAMVFVNTPVGTAGAADYYEVTGVQIDISSVALPFRTNATTIEQELTACQRYYAIYRSYVLPSSPFGQTDLRPEMRVTPTVGGGGTGFTVLDSSTSFVLSLQTAAAVQGLTFSSEL